MTDKVVDASAIATIIFDEPSRPVAESATHGAVLFAPTLIGYELGNVCLKKIRQRPNERDALLSALQAYPAFGIMEEEIASNEVIALAEQKRLSLYDASYLWLADKLGAELVTLDKRLARADKP